MLSRASLSSPHLFPVRHVHGLGEYPGVDGAGATTSQAAQGLGRGGEASGRPADKRDVGVAPDECACQSETEARAAAGDEDVVARESGQWAFSAGEENHRGDLGARAAGSSWQDGEVRREEKRETPFALHSSLLSVPAAPRPRSHTRQASRCRSRRPVDPCPTLRPPGW